MPPNSRFDVGRRTDVGRKRDHNEDSFAIREPAELIDQARHGRVYVVADGMGGHQAGDIASTTAVETIVDVYFSGEGDTPARVKLEDAIRAANARIREMATKPGQEGMGTTLVAAIVDGDRALIANIGDSRAYRVRNNAISQLSHDHSWVAEAVANGILTPEQAKTHPRRNAITRSLGTRAEVQADYYDEEFRPGDVLVLCSDGLSGQVDDEDICRIVTRNDAQTAADLLVALANQNGGPDNITVVVVRNGEPPRKSKIPPFGLLAAALSVVLLCGAGGLFWWGAGDTFGAAPRAQIGIAPTQAPPDLLTGQQAQGGEGLGPTSTPAPDATSTPTPRPTTVATARPAATQPPASTVAASGPSLPGIPIIAPQQATATATPRPPSQLTPSNLFVPTNTPAPPTPTSQPGDDSGGGGAIDRR